MNTGVVQVKNLCIQPKPWHFEIDGKQYERMSSVEDIDIQEYRFSFGSAKVLDKTIAVFYDLNKEPIGVCEVIIDEDLPKARQLSVVGIIYGFNAKEVLLCLAPFLSR